jgi:hypothetical protein
MQALELVRGRNEGLNGAASLRTRVLGRPSTRLREGTVEIGPNLSKKC